MITAAVISGGTGSRLWPASRLSYPKPFIKLQDGETLIQKTYSRTLEICSKILTITNRDYYFLSKDAINELGIEGSFLLEPFGKNTAPAIALAAHQIVERTGSDALLLVLPADHLVLDQQAFEAAVLKAINLAESNYLVTFGIVPSAPETGYGYLEKGENLGCGYRVKRFVEKPDLATAQELVASGRYFWNSGMFCFKAQVFLDELAAYAPDVSQSIASCWATIKDETHSSAIEIPADLFAKVPDISVDYAVMEKSDRVAVVPGDFGWSDIGSWNALKDLIEPDADGNRLNEDAIAVDSQNIYVQSDRLVAAVGVSNLMIIDTPDALLVANPDSAQKLKDVVSILKARDHDAYKLHRTVSRPWGTYTVLEEGPRFKIKRIEVKPGAILSLQMHHHRSEHWVVVNGTARITNGESETLIQSNQSTYIPAGQRHRLENPGVIPCVMIEVQCGGYLGEDDIVRFEDHYGRQ
jgi:mannose-1-phosphate guanylyltransferase